MHPPIAKALSAGTVKYTNYISAEGKTLFPNECPEL